MSSEPADKPTIAFFGTPAFAVAILDELEAASLTPDAVVTAPDRPAGRGLVLTAPPVKVWANERDIPVLQPATLKHTDRNLDIDQNIDLLLNTEWDIFIVASYGKILPKYILDIPAKGTLNVHPSLLPRFRGASPIESQILADEREVGVTIMLMDELMDHGPIVAQASITPEVWPPRASLLEALFAHEGGRLLAETIPPWLAGTVTPEPQQHELATVTKKIDKADGEISLDGDPYQNYLKFCAYDGWPGVYYFAETAKGRVRVKITDAKFENGHFIPLKVVPEGKKEMPFATFQNS